VGTTAHGVPLGVTGQAESTRLGSNIELIPGDTCPGITNRVPKTFSVLNKTLEESNEEGTPMRDGCAIFHGQVPDILIIQSKKILDGVNGCMFESCTEWAVFCLVQHIANDMVEGSDAAGLGNNSFTWTRHDNAGGDSTGRLVMDRR
jgi:hypothetical protein